jgi:hypothetical protein
MHCLELSPKKWSIQLEYSHVRMVSAYDDICLSLRFYLSGNKKNLIFIKINPQPISEDVSLLV